MRSMNKGQRKKTSHNEAYWQRLREQFKTCDYDNAGAYQKINCELSAPMQVLADEIEEMEQVLLTDKHQELRKVGYFEANVPDHQQYLRAHGK
jgi:hypothetical protein